MRPYVFGEVSRGGEGPVACGANVRLLPRVHFHVHAQRRLLCERLRAIGDRAAEGTLARVAQFVSLQII